MAEPKKCILDDQKICDGCGECDRCDLDPNKICDNCMKCMGVGSVFRRKSKGFTCRLVVRRLMMLAAFSAPSAFSRTSCAYSRPPVER